MSEIQYEIKENKMFINLSGIQEVEHYIFGFYLIKDNEPVLKITNSKNPLQTFELRENGVYGATIFIKDLILEETKIYSMPSFHYLANRKPRHLPYVKIEEMEMTNICNLACENCCTPTTSYPRGYIDDRTVLAVLAWTSKGQTLNYHRQGEPLLHKKLDKYIKWGTQVGIRPLISTNGILLNNEKFIQLYQAGLRHLTITLHTEKSLEAFVNICDYLQKEKINTLHFSELHKVNDKDALYFSGKILDFPTHINQSSHIKKLGSELPKKYKSFLEYADTHTWAGNVKNTTHYNPENLIKHKQNHCYFIQKKVINVRWDGTIVGCCFDSENDNEIGHIRDFSTLEINMDKFHLCKSCDSNWAVKE